MKCLMKYAVVLMGALLAGCSTPQGQAALATLETGKGIVQDAIDAKMDADRDAMCNLASYRAKMAARKRWNLKQPTWDDFCGRITATGGR